MATRPIAAAGRHDRAAHPACHAPGSATGDDHDPRPSDHTGLLALALPALLLTAGLAHTAARACFAQAVSFLPADLFTGPVPAGVTVHEDGTRAADPNDPLHYSRSGYLYLVQHDVSQLLTDWTSRWPTTGVPAGAGCRHDLVRAATSSP
jgi:hypothetical protein